MPSTLWLHVNCAHISSYHCSLFESVDGFMAFQILIDFCKSSPDIPQSIIYSEGAIASKLSHTLQHVYSKHSYLFIYSLFSIISPILSFSSLSIRSSLSFLYLSDSMEAEKKKGTDITLCEVCHDHPAKYTCPGCKKRTCSLQCVRKHKKDVLCLSLVFCLGQLFWSSRPYTFCINV